jgi:hypothetical protein
MSVRYDRVTENEAIFRRINEGIASWSEEQAASATEEVEYYCECADRHCFERIWLTNGEFEALRAQPGRFAVVPKHVVLQLEHVVEWRLGYAVVEKHGA